jgi:hypothetical protein
MAAAEASFIKFYSELGRMAGHYERGGLWNLMKHFGQRFDWFLGVEPQVVIQEKEKAWVCFAVYIMGLAGFSLVRIGLKRVTTVFGIWAATAVGGLGYVVHLINTRPSLFG